MQPPLLCLPEFQKNDLQAKCSKEMALQSYKQKPVPIQDSKMVWEAAVPKEVHHT